MTESSETTSIFRIIMFLGFVFLVSSVLTQPWVYVGQPLPPNSTWGQMQTQFENFPTYNNPFAPNTVQFIHFPNGNDAYNGSNFVSTFGCANATYYLCVQTNDGNSSYIILSAAHPNVEVNMTLGNPTIPGIMRQFVIKVTCRSLGVPVSLSRVFSGGQYVDTTDACPLDQFQTLSYNMPAPWAYNSTSAAMNANMVGVNIIAGYNIPTPPSNAQVEITALEVDIYSDQANSVCGGNILSNIACTVGNFAQGFFKGIIAFINAVIFIASIAIWFITILGIFFFALFAVVSIPGAPPIVTGIVGIVILGTIVTLAIILMGKAKPTGV